jgi:hypothetical protein
MMCARSLVTAVALLGLATASQAASVTYDVSSGSITTIQLVALSGSVQPCPIGGGINCLSSGALAIDVGSITLDENGLTLDNVTLTASGTGTLALGGLFGYTSVDFSNTTFQSSGSSALTGGGGTYSFNAPGTITTDLVLNTLGGPIALPGTVFPGSPTGSITVSGGQLYLNLQGVNLGMICDPQNPANCVIVKADFQVLAQNPIPEPNAAIVFGLGALIVGAALRRSRN